MYQDIYRHRLPFARIILGNGKVNERKILSSYPFFYTLHFRVRTKKCSCWCAFNWPPPGGAVSPPPLLSARPQPLSARPNHFIHLYPECKVIHRKTSAASSSPGYHGDKRHISPLSPPPAAAATATKASLFPPSPLRRKHPQRVPMQRTFTRDWGKDTAAREAPPWQRRSCTQR